MNNIDKVIRAGLTAYLSGFLSGQKLKRMNDVLDMRTRKIVVALENIYHPHNASAVLRSCDCFGIQNVYTIENRNMLDISSGVSMNAQKWLSLTRFRDKTADNLVTGINALKADGYMIVAASPHSDNPIASLSIDKKLALLFGSEKDGLSDEALRIADQAIGIPMYGFTESYNLSVSVALCLYDLTERMRQHTDDWHLSANEKEELLLEWMIKSVRAGKRLASLYLSKQMLQINEQSDEP